LATANESIPGETTKTITISMPAAMAAKVEALAESEGRTVSELFLAAFRGYQAVVFDQWWKEVREYADVLVTGDKDLASLGRYGGTRIITPTEYVEMPA